ncbi:MAG: DUF1207 domain-containing protein [Pirellulales bacterium]|nr:DUF1207 domain-containing protein [Pirellulales bacterium]
MSRCAASLLLLIVGLSPTRAAIAQTASLGEPVLIDAQYGSVGEQIAAPPQPAAAPAPEQYLDLNYSDRTFCAGDYPDNYAPAWTWQVVPTGLIYRNYLAGPREPRLSAIYNWQVSGGTNRFADFTLGGHAGLLRYGSADGPRPGGFQLDVEGAAFPRLDPRNEWDLRGADFRGGFPLTFGYGPWELKTGYYHISSHLGDEFLLKNPGYPRINYVRDEIALGVAYRVRPPLRLFAEADYAFHRDGGARPWIFQFGVDCSQLEPTGFRGSPFLAVHGYVRQEVNWGGSISAQAGWQWRGYGPGHLLRFGVNYFNGKTVQFSFLNDSEQLTGLGLWYDF